MQNIGYYVFTGKNILIILSVMSIIRDVTIKAQKYIDDDRIIILVGARQAGKTTILKQLQKILKEKNNLVYFLNLEDPEWLGLLNKSPKNLFKIFPININQKNFLIIDEIQYLNNPTSFLKYFWDEHRNKIKIIVSSSSAFYIDKNFKDSLVGQKKIFYVRTLSFREFLRFKNKDNLSKKNFQEISLSERDEITANYYEYMIYGGYPRVVLSPIQEKKDILRDIAYSYIKKDIYESNIRQDETFYRLFKILASQVGNLVNTSELAGTLGVSRTSIDNYLYIMQKSFHIALVKPFFKNIRKELTKMPKVYFWDTGLRNFFVSNFDGLEGREDKGRLLENITFRELAEKYPIDEIKFWRTAQGNEIDFIIEDNLAYEVKINAQKFKESHYKTFLKNYPQIKLSLISLDKEEKLNERYKILNPWEIPSF